MNHEQMIEDATSDLDNTEGWAADAGRPETARKLAQVAYRAFHPTITTTEELDKQASETVIRDDAGFVYEQDRIDTGLPTAWLRVGKCHTVSATEVHLPATVLHIPGGAA